MAPDRHRSPTRPRLDRMVTIVHRSRRTVLEATALRGRRLAASLRPRDRAYLAEIDDRWAPHLGRPADPQEYLRFAELTGRREVLLVPRPVLWDILLPRLNDLAVREALCDKNLSDQLLGFPPGPETYLRRVHGHYLDARYAAVADVEVPERLRALHERGVASAVIKPSRSDNGDRITVLELDALGVLLDGQRVAPVHLERLFGPDLLVQEHLTQHPAMAAPHPASVNTVRLRTLRWRGRIEPLPSLLRFGVGGRRNDNVRTGGLACGIEPDGRLRPYAVDRRLRATTAHPTTGVTFAGTVVPGWDEVVALGQRLHERVQPFDLVAWDIAIDPDERPRLLELNVRGDSAVPQLATGRPLFGDLTAAVLDELVTPARAQDAVARPRRRR
jgi:hypothetical protein